MAQDRKIENNFTEFYSRYLNALFTECKRPEIKWQAMPDSYNSYTFPTSNKEMIPDIIGNRTLFIDAGEADNKDEIIKILSLLNIPHAFNEKNNRIEVSDFSPLEKDMRLFFYVFIAEYFRTLPQDKVKEVITNHANNSDLNNFIMFQSWRNSLDYYLPVILLLSIEGSKLDSSLVQDVLQKHTESLYHFCINTYSYNNQMKPDKKEYKTIITSFFNNFFKAATVKDEGRCEEMLKTTFDSLAKFKLLNPYVTNNPYTNEVKQMESTLSLFIPVKGVRGIVTSYQDSIYIPEAIKEFVDKNMNHFGHITLYFKDFCDVWLKLNPQVELKKRGVRLDFLH